MKRIVVALALSVFALPLFAAVESIFPRVGTVSGGDTITIDVDTPLEWCQICSPPLAVAEVTFDGIAGNVVAILTDTRIEVVTPPHGGGTVPVVVTSNGKPYGTTTFQYAGVGGPIAPSSYEKILVPLALPADRVLPGAFGSQWKSEMWVRNRSAKAVELFNDVTCTVVCPQYFAPDPQYPQIGANSFSKVEPLDAGGGVGFLYYVQKTYSRDVDFSLHVADVSRSKENAGTELGVVRERDFRGPSFDILNVPIDSVSRATLRIYDADSREETFAEVFLYSMESGALLGQTRVEMKLPVPRAATMNAALVPPFASFAQIPDLRTWFPTLPSGRIGIGIRMLSTAHAWAFVSVTNNSTQLMTTFRPE